jgi:ubiquinone/menaquinone biosynthesis C-methylase UbiE
MTRNINISYIHGTTAEEQQRLANLNTLTNSSFIDFLQIRKTDRILELGSGLGILAEKISHQLTTGKVTGIEISEAQLAGCPAETGKLEFIQGDVHRLPLENNSFHTVYCRYILEHVNDPLQVLREAKRVLKPGGTIYIQENSILLMEFYPDCPHFKKVWMAFADYQSGIGGDAMIGIRLYEMLKRAGFVHPELSLAPEIHYHEKGTLVPWIDNLIGNIMGARNPLIQNNFITTREFSQALKELENFKKNDYASSYFYWNRAKAVKPVSIKASPKRSTLVQQL